MILVDANLLVYAHVASMGQHEAARNWLDERLNGTALFEILLAKGKGSFLPDVFV